MAKIALDIDSTLHHYWDLLAEVAQQRYGVALPYDTQDDWGIPGLDREQLIDCVRETHSAANVLGAVPYPGAVETVQDWHRTGHWIHITSHRSAEALAVTGEWLEAIGLPYDDLHCSYDKISRCVELEIDVLIDDSPVNIAGALERGIKAATIVHPWNAELVRSGQAIGAADWPGLRKALEPHLPDHRSPRDKPREA